MVILQNILVYLTLALAVSFIVKKFLLPRPVKTLKKGFEKPCGQNGSCGCN